MPLVNVLKGDTHPIQQHAFRYITRRHDDVPLIGKLQVVSSKITMLPRQTRSAVNFFGHILGEVISNRSSFPLVMTIVFFTSWRRFNLNIPLSLANDFPPGRT